MTIPLRTFGAKQRRTSIEDLRDMMRAHRGKSVQIALTLTPEVCDMLVVYLKTNAFETIQDAFLAFMEHTIKEAAPERFAMNQVLKEYITSTLKVIGQETSRFTGELYSRVQRDIEAKINDIETR